MPVALTKYRVPFTKLGYFPYFCAIHDVAVAIRQATSVDAVGRFKPDPAVYQLACEASGVEAARIGFVTANGWDAATSGG